MNYDKLQQLIDDKITRQLEELRIDAMDLKLRNSAKVSALNTVLLALTDEQRKEVAKKLNLVR
jgi:ribosome recycling factor